MSPECPTPGAIPMAGNGTTGRIGRFLEPLRSLAGFIHNLCRQDRPEDPKRLAVIISASALALGFLGCVATISRLALVGKALDNGLLTFAAGVGVTLGGLAGFVHRKPDDPMPGGDR